MPYKVNFHLIRSVLDWYQEGVMKSSLFLASKTIDGAIIISMHNLTLASALVSLCSIFEIPLIKNFKERLTLHTAQCIKLYIYIYI